MTNEPKTIVNVKIKGGRTMRDMLHLAVLLGIMAIGFTAFGAFQVAMCKDKTPEKSWQECIKKRPDSKRHPG